jgi:hypothetical protein
LKELPTSYNREQQRRKRKRKFPILNKALPIAIEQEMREIENNERER